MHTQKPDRINDETEELISTEESFAARHGASLIAVGMFAILAVFIILEIFW